MNSRLILTLLLCLPLLTFGQSIQDEFAQQVCDCAQQEKVTTTDALDKCIQKTILKNAGNILQHFDASSFDELNLDNFFSEIGIKIAQNCDYLETLFSDPNQEFSDGFEAKDNIDCSDFKNGNFYYLMQNYQTKQYDTTYVAIKDKLFLETMNNGKTYSLLDINWLDNCAFELVFKNSNDPDKNAFSDPGDTYKYEVVDRTPNSLILKLDWNDQLIRIEFFKRN